MPNRQRQQTDACSASPNILLQDEILINGKTALERKLELLETRFTMPLDQQQSRYQQCYTNNNNSPDTLGENSSPASITTGNHSHHSFGFDTPSLSYSNNPNHTMKQGTASDKAQELQPNEASNSTSKGGWQCVAAAHMAKVALQQLTVNNSQECTLLTSHVNQSKSLSTEAVSPIATSSNPVTIQLNSVRESPPFFSPKVVCSNEVSLFFIYVLGLFAITYM